MTTALRTLSRVERLRRLEEMLEMWPYGAKELADKMGVKRRTIERDLQLLKEEYGDRLHSERGRYSLRHPASSLNPVEALAMYMAARMLTHTGFGEQHYVATMKDLAKQVPEPARTVLLRRAAALVKEDRDRVLDIVAQAWFDRRVLGCTYEAAGGRRSKRELLVYFVEVGRRNHEPYALAVDRAAPERVKVFKFARMRDVRLLPDTFEIPEDFDPDATIGDSFGVLLGESVRVSVRLRPGVLSSFREVSGDALESVEEGPDGGAVAVVRATLDDRGKALELVPWLLSWGDALEVLGPPVVRDDVRARLAAAAEQYGE
jgi:predicted DNA-binding transcriptional regulator YafY